MDPIKQRIEIAKVHLGFEDFDWLIVAIDLPRILHGAKRNESRWIEVPYYLSDLNAMHEAEKTLKDWNKYVCMIAKVIVGDTRPKASGNDYHVATSVIIHATAAQRAEAFLRTIGKWENS